jgi:hypothetical protein
MNVIPNTTGAYALRFYRDAHQVVTHYREPIAGWTLDGEGRARPVLPRPAFSPAVALMVVPTDAGNQYSNVGARAVFTEFDAAAAWAEMQLLKAERRIEEEDARALKAAGLTSAEQAVLTYVEANPGTSSRAVGQEVREGFSQQALQDLVDAGRIHETFGRYTVAPAAANA